MEADFVSVKICPECKKELKTSYQFFLHYIKEHHRHQKYWYNSFELGSYYTISLTDGAIITEEDGEVVLKKFIGNGSFDAPLESFVDTSFENSQSVDSSNENTQPVYALLKNSQPVYAMLENSTPVISSVENLEPVDVLNQDYSFGFETSEFSDISTVASASKTYSTLDETVSSVASGSIGILTPLPPRTKKLSVTSVQQSSLTKQRRDLKLFCEFCGNGLKPFRSYTAVVKHEIEEGHVSAKQSDDRFLFYHQKYPSSLRYKYV